MLGVPCPVPLPRAPLVLLLVLASVALGKRERGKTAEAALPSQFQATCYAGCECNATTVACKDLGATDTAMFAKATPRVFPDLDTVSVTGNNLGALPSENLFGERARHFKLSMLDLSGNGIQSFFSDTFFGCPKVEYLYLRNNELETVGSKPFDYMPMLRVIDLSGAFASSLSSTRKSQLLSNLLESGHGFKELEELILTGNDLQTFDNQVFCKTPALTRLILAENRLVSFDAKARCLSNLRQLDLRDNRLTQVPALVYDELELNAIDVSHNPLQCNCQLQPFVKVAVEDPSIFLNQQQSLCEGPTSVAGKSIFALEKTNLCQGRSGGGLLHWFVLLVVGGGVLFLYRHLRRAGRFPRMATVFGYSQLKDNDEATSRPTHPQPAFV